MPPSEPKLYHITHIDNLAPILADGCLWSDAERLRRGGEHQNVGMSEIKERRLVLPVHCHPGTKVGEYVPFYFCPRSIMLYVLHRGNHPNLSYRGGQRPILHLELDLHRVVAWADRQGVRWAFSDRNAGTSYAGFFRDLGQLDRVNWLAVDATDFRDALVKDGKQAEFLVYERVPWALVDKVGAIDAATAESVAARLRDAPHQPVIRVEGGWYY